MKVYLSKYYFFGVYDTTYVFIASFLCVHSNHVAAELTSLVLCTAHMLQTSPNIGSCAEFYSNSVL